MFGNSSSSLKASTRRAEHGKSQFFEPKSNLSCMRDGKRVGNPLQCIPDKARARAQFWLTSELWDQPPPPALPCKTLKYMSRPQTDPRALPSTPRTRVLCGAPHNLQHRADVDGHVAIESGFPGAATASGRCRSPERLVSNAERLARHLIDRVHQALWEDLDRGGPVRVRRKEHDPSHRLPVDRDEPRARVHLWGVMASW